MGIAFQRRTVHVRARVALVRVADHVLLALRLLRRGLPLHASREARAATTAETGLLHLFDDLLRRHLEENLLERLVAVTRNVILNLLGIDHAAVAKNDTELLLVERDVRLSVRILRLRGIVAETANDAALHEMFGDDLLDVLDLDVDVERALRHDLDDRTLLAETETARLENLNLAGETRGLELLLELGRDVVRAARATSRAAADEDMRFDSHDA